MSTASTTESYECRHCNGPREAGTAFCSETCRYRQHGERILDQLEADHRECSTCFRPVFYPRPKAIDGRTTFLPPTAIDAIEEATHEPYPPRTHRHRVGCECGAVNPNDTHTILRNVRDPERRRAFVGCLWRLADKEAIVDYPDPHAFREAFECGVRDWAELAGRCVYADG